MDALSVDGYKLYFCSVIVESPHQETSGLATIDLCYHSAEDGDMTC